MLLKKQRKGRGCGFGGHVNVRCPDWLSEERGDSHAETRRKTIPSRSSSRWEDSGENKLGVFKEKR